MQENSKRRITLNSDKAKGSAAARKLTGHEYLLQQIKNEGKVVSFVFTSGVEVEGAIVEFDKFTITLKFENGDTRCFFKHAIESFG